MIVQNYDDVNLASVVGVYLDIALELHMSQGIKLESDFRLRQFAISSGYKILQRS